MKICVSLCPHTDFAGVYFIPCYCSYIQYVIEKIGGGE